MTQLTVIEAAKLAGKDRKSIYRAIKSGRLSATKTEGGGTQIDVAELERCFGALGRGHGSATVALPQSATGEETARIAALEAECRLLREALESEKRLTDAKDAHIEDLRNAVRRLEDKRPAGNSPWWKWNGRLL